MTDIAGDLEQAPLRAYSGCITSGAGNHHHHVPDGFPDSEYANRDARAIHLKLDELIRSVNAARNNMISIGKLMDEELESLAKKYDRIRAEFEARKNRAA